MYLFLTRKELSNNLIGLEFKSVAPEAQGTAIKIPHSTGDFEELEDIELYCEGTLYVTDKGDSLQKTSKWIVRSDGVILKNCLGDMYNFFPG
jgi:hypothetical protein